MENIIMKNELQNILNPSLASMKVLVAYDKLGCGIRAKDLCDRLTQHLAPTCKLQLSFWSLSALQLPLLARAAEDEATQTELLIIAVNGDEALPPSIKSWISRCTRRLRSHAGALAVQLHGILRMNQELSPTYKCLKHIADDAGVHIFSEVVELAGEKVDNSIKSIHKRAHMRSPVLETILPLH
jgi:hypothetical protein